MRQHTLSDEGFERYRKPTRRDPFLYEIQHGCGEPYRSAG